MASSPMMTSSPVPSGHGHFCPSSMETISHQSVRYLFFVKFNSDFVAFPSCDHLLCIAIMFRFTVIQIKVTDSVR